MTHPEEPFADGDFAGPCRVGGLIEETQFSFVYESYYPEKREKLSLNLIKKAAEIRN
jgi:hypothetical protein